MMAGAPVDLPPECGYVFRVPFDRIDRYMPGKVNEAKWTRAKQIAAKQGRPRDWALIAVIYKSLGGSFR